MSLPCPVAYDLCRNDRVIEEADHWKEVVSEVQQNCEWAKLEIDNDFHAKIIRLRTTLRYLKEATKIITDEMERREG